MNNYLEKVKAEACDPIEIVKSAMKLAKELQDSNWKNNEYLNIIYSDIQMLNKVVSTDAPYDYIKINRQITEKYSALPAVGNITFVPISLEELQEKSEEENKQILALMAKSLSILMTNVKVNNATNIFANALLEHFATAGLNALYKK